MDPKTRPIKFRAWDLVTKKMYQVQSLTLDFKICDLWDGVEEHEGIARDIDNVVIMQLTGLKDKNGKDIYEGDVVRKYREVNTSYGFDVHEITWRRCAFVLLATDADNEWGGYLLYKTEEKLEVIGNIYENPNLLSK